MFNRLDDTDINMLKPGFEQMIFEKEAVFQAMFDKGITDEERVFLKNTKLNQIKFRKNPAVQNTFFIINKKDSSEIAVSNRVISRDELRGEVLRKKLNGNKSKTQTIYDFLTQNNQNIFTFDYFVLLNSAITESSKRHFYQLVEYLIYEQVKNKTDRATFWDGVNFEDIAERANQIYLERANQLSNYPFIDALIQLQAQTRLLNAAGYLDASNALQKIHDGLIVEFVDLSKDTNQFKNNCLDILNMNNYPELKVQHHLFKKVLSVLAQLFNFLSFGLIPQYKTESERMVISLFNNLNSISLEPETQSHLVSPV